MRGCVYHVNCAVDFSLMLNMSSWRLFLSALLGERDRWIYWLPVFLGAGIGLYFSLPLEPPLWVWCVLCVLLAGLRYFFRSYAAAHNLITMLLVILIGAGAAGLRTYVCFAPMLDRAISPVMIEGSVVERELRGQGGRILLADITSDRRNLRLPHSVRLTLRDGMPPVGSRIRVLANLLPVSEPPSPGGYDFRMQAYFEGVGATGIALRPPELIEQQYVSPGLAEGWRETAAQRISTVIGGSEGAIAVALMTGERGAIDEKTNEDMRKAGTAHLLSISGMHIGMVGGFIFFVLRSLMALSPAFALHHPIKKYAAVIALIAVVAYTWLVGAPIPAQRSVLMAGLVFVAILLDRQALSMRSVALAAGVILLLFPESLLNPGFQMSFSAILMLIAAYEWWQMRQSDDDRVRPGWWGRSWRYVAGIVVTSLIAGFATMPFGAYHFHRLQLLGVLGNLVAVPLTGFVIMPAMVLAYVLLPFGYEWPALKVMGWGLDGVTSSAAWVAEMPGADITVPQFSIWALVLMCLGGLWLAIWRQRIRLIGILFILAGVALVPFYGRPTVLVSAEGRVAVRGLDGHLYYERPPRGLIARDWSRGYDGGHAAQSWREASQSGVSCEALGCVAQQGIALIRRPEALAEDCQRAKLVIAPDEKVHNCAVAVIDSNELRTHGAHLVFADGEIKTARSGSNRPWQPYYGAQGVSYTGASGRQAAPVP